MTKMKLQQQFHLTPPAHAQCHQVQCHLHWWQLQQEGWMSVRMEQINQKYQLSITNELVESNSSYGKFCALCT